MQDHCLPRLQEPNNGLWGVHCHQGAMQLPTWWNGGIWVCLKCLPSYLRYTQDKYYSWYPIINFNFSYYSLGPEANLTAANCLNGVAIEISGGCHAYLAMDNHEYGQIFQPGFTGMWGLAEHSGGVDTNIFQNFNKAKLFCKTGKIRNHLYLTSYNSDNIIRQLLYVLFVGSSPTLKTKDCPQDWKIGSCPLVPGTDIDPNEKCCIKPWIWQEWIEIIL